MNNFSNIQKKLNDFIRKYYTNEIIKGSILFLSFGLLYFIFTLFVEYFLWLKPLARTMLFWLFIAVEFGLLTKLIIFPILKLVGMQKGISLTDASKLIGKHFKEVDDKLLNVLQLNKSKLETDLLIASIEQKAKNLQPIPFKKAIILNKNIKYLKYLFVPVGIWLIVIITGHNSIFTQSFNRVVHHKTAYSPPAPFRFKILNNDLQAIEGKSFVLKVITIGNVIPEEVKINFSNETYYLNRSNNGELTYIFEYPNQDIDFYLEANNVDSNVLTLNVIDAPRIVDFKMILNYPEYLKKESELITNTGNAMIPEGTDVTWKISTQNTKTMNFISFNNGERKVLGSLRSNNEKLAKGESGLFEITKKIKYSFTYQVNTSNNFIEEFEKLNYQIQVIKDEFPKIFVKSDIDSVTRGPIQFVGQLTDDYGLSRLQVIAKNSNSNTINTANIKINYSDFEEFYYLFPEGLVLVDGAEYEIYFEIFDNDAIHGRKKSTSQIFYYRNKTQREIDDEILIEQNNNLEELESFSKNSDEIQKALEEFSKKLKNKKNTDWNDKKQFDEFLERQKKYQIMLQENSDKLLQNIEEMNEEENLSLEDKKQELKERIKENKELQEKEQLLKELQELAEKLKKEGLIEQVDRLLKQNKQEKRSLERILELTKRFYVEKKSAQIVKKLNELSKEQLDLSKEENKLSEEQLQLNKKFESIQKDFKELMDQNKSLKQPMQLQDTEADQKLIEMEMKEALYNLQDSDKVQNNSPTKSKAKAKKNQISAAKKMDELSKKMEASFMQMDMESNEENIKDLQQILKNLILFSFEQESLMLEFNDINSKNAEYPERLKQQLKLKDHFDHIDDSLYSLSLRLVRLTAKIQKDLTDAHYNLDKSLLNITENRINLGISNQQFTMTAANNLADLLSDILEDLQNKKPGSGKGKGKEGEELSLPDIIKKQKELIQKLKDGDKPGNAKGKITKEQLSGEQFQLYKEQNLLKEQLRDILQQHSIEGKQSIKILKQMEELEKLLLEKGINNESLQRMERLEYELLKLEEATFEQNKKKERKSDTNKEKRVQHSVKPLNIKNINLNEDEILIRQNIMLQPKYQKRIKVYFNSENQ